MTTINEERNYGELKESTRMMKSKKSGKKVNLVKKDKKQALMKLLNAIKLSITV